MNKLKNLPVNQFLLFIIDNVFLPILAAMEFETGGIYVAISLFSFMFALRACQKLILQKLDKSKTPELKDTAKESVIKQISNLCDNGGLLTEDEFNRSRNYFLEQRDRLVKLDGKASTSPLAAIGNPNAASGMMTRQIVSMAPNILSMFAVNMFPQVIVGKLPISIPAKFAGLTQRGVVAAGLPACYFSTQSWYIVCMIITPLLVRVIFGASKTDVNSMMGMGGGAAPTGMSIAQSIERLKCVRYDELALMPGSLETVEREELEECE